MAPSAPLLVMTTEVLRNLMYSETSASRLDAVSWVVLDEVHYLQDAERGSVWEEIIIHAPGHIKFVCLSATVSNASQFGAWLRERRGNSLDVVVSAERPVPLTHLHMVRDESTSQLRRIPLLTDAGKPDVGASHLIDNAPRRITTEWVADDWEDDEDDRYGYGYDEKWRFRTPSAPAVIQSLRSRQHLPALFFIFSRDGCDRAVNESMQAKLRLTNGDERRRIREIVTDRLSMLPEEDLRALDADRWAKALESGIAAHHAGVLPLLKETVEHCFDAGLVKVVFATETMALGVNMPARTVVLDKLTKWNGQGHAPLSPMQYSQISGRAGRRGIDNEGHVVSLWSPYVPVKDAARLAASRKFSLKSSFSPNYNMVIRLAQRFDRDKSESFLWDSYTHFLKRESERSVAAQIDKEQSQIDAEVRKSISLMGDISEYEQLLIEAADQAPDRLRERSAPDLGDVLRINGGEPLVVVKATDTAAGRRFSTINKENQIHTFKPPNDDIILGFCGVISGLPSAISRRSLSQQTNVEAIKKLRSEAWHLLNDTGSDITERITNHPVNADPMLSKHLRRLSNARTRQRKLDLRIGQVTERPDKLISQFADVVGVLEHFEYMNDWMLSDKGKVLAGIHHENDLLVSESIHNGFLDDLSDEELAGAVSVMVHEQRGPATFKDRFPDGELAETACKSIMQLSKTIRSAEGKAGAHLTKATDMRYFATASAWTSGCSLSEALASSPAGAPQLSAGDFARNMLILSDVLRQIAHAAPQDALRQQAERVSSTLLRGAVTAGAPLTESRAHESGRQD